MINDEHTPDLELDETKDQDENNQDESQDDTQNKDESSNDDKDLRAELLKQKAINDRLTKRLNKPETNSAKKSNDLDYGEKSYLISNGIKREEISFVQDELKKSGLKDVDSLLDNPYFQSSLEKHRALSATQNAIPKGNRSGDMANNSIEYYASKPIEDVPQEFRAKVVKYKLDKENKKGVFYNS